MADKIVSRLRGLDAIKENWELYDPRNRKLTDLLRQTDWLTLKRCADMRNNLVHGTRVYDLAECQRQVRELMGAMNRLKTLFDSEYGYSGWTTASRRSKSTLHSDPKVQFTP